MRAFDILKEEIYKIRTIRVFRWQHKETGYGPLCARNDDPFMWWQVLFHDHNGPEGDEWVEYKNQESHIKSNHFFAWDSLDKFLNILKEGAEDLLENRGYEMTEWEISEAYIVMEDGQVYFDRTKATRIN